MKRIVPFSNGTETMVWLEDNCESCKTKSGCSARRNIEQGFVTGEITIHAAKFIGYDEEEDGLYSTCQHRNGRILPTRKRLIHSGQTNLL